ncbi:MAG: hypothetical protein ACHQ1H_10075 [Nitrososphaerales archaeon]
MQQYPEAFKTVTGVDLVPGTINVQVLENREIRIKEEFRMDDPVDSNQVLLFESCQINGIPGFRIRPYNKTNGLGGHGDHILEISSAQRIPSASTGTEVTIEFFKRR